MGGKAVTGAAEGFRNIEMVFREVGGIVPTLWLSIAQVGFLHKSNLEQ